MWSEQWMWEERESEWQVSSGWWRKRSKLGPPPHLKLTKRKTSLQLVLYLSFPWKTWRITYFDPKGEKQTSKQREWLPCFMQRIRTIDYWQLLSAMCSHSISTLDITEIWLSYSRWDDINYPTLSPMRAKETGREKSYMILKDVNRNILIKRLGVGQVGLYLWEICSWVNTSIGVKWHKKMLIFSH